MSNRNLIKSIIFLALIFATSSVHAWIEPTTVPPGNNIYAPLNTSSFGQSKIGGLILNIGNAAHGLIVRYGLVGIGTDSPESELDVRGETKTDSLTVRGATTFNGNLTVAGSVASTGNISTQNSVCIKGDCKSAWPMASNDTLQTVTARGNTSNGAVNINGDLSFNGVLSTPNRMHINGQEDLYILNKGTTHISKAWGGTGNLAVEGNLCVGGDCRNNWCPNGYMSIWKSDGPGTIREACFDKNAGISCSNGEITVIVPYHEAKYINGEKYTRAKIYPGGYTGGPGCDSGYVKGTSAQCSMWVFYPNGTFTVYSNWNSSPLGGIVGRWSHPWWGNQESCSSSF